LALPSAFHQWIGEAASAELAASANAAKATSATSAIRFTDR
jgi:hypothetical protein